MKNTDEYLAHIRETSPWRYGGTHEEICSVKSDYLRHVASQAPLGLDWAEFGVENGWSARVFAECISSDQTLYLFDAFLGLPEDWIVGDPEDIKFLGSGWPAGSFKADSVPDFSGFPNVVLTQGWFADTLKPWSEGYHGSQLGFVHIDCDLYSSSKTVYEFVGRLIKPGTIIAFDELTKNHDKKAFFEFLNDSNYSFEYIGAIKGALQVSVSIKH